MRRCSRIEAQPPLEQGRPGVAGAQIGQGKGDAGRWPAEHQALDGVVVAQGQQDALLPKLVDERSEIVVEVQNLVDGQAEARGEPVLGRTASSRAASRSWAFGLPFPLSTRSF